MKKKEPIPEFIPGTRIELDWGDRFNFACPLKCPECKHYPLPGIYDWEMHGTTCAKCGYYHHQHVLVDLVPVME